MEKLKGMKKITKIIPNMCTFYAYMQYQTFSLFDLFTCTSQKVKTFLFYIICRCTKKNEAIETKGVSGVVHMNEPRELDSKRGDVHVSIISHETEWRVGVRQRMNRTAYSR